MAFDLPNCESSHLWSILLELRVVLLQPRFLSLQLLVPPTGLVAFFPRTTQLLRQFPDAAERVEGLEKQIIL